MKSLIKILVLFFVVPAVQVEAIDFSKISTLGVSFPGNYLPQVQRLGDANGDGKEDFVISSVNINADVDTLYYRVDIYYGKPELNLFPDLTIFNKGYQVETDFDLNNDGYSDLAIFGRPQGLLPSAYRITLYLGSMNGFTESDSYVMNLEFNTGFVYSSAGDINSDGYDDIAYFCDPAGTLLPHQRVGNIILGGSDIDLEVDFQFMPPDSCGTEDYGSSCVIADMNMDGYEDLMTTSCYPESNFADCSGFYIFPGGMMLSDEAVFRYRDSSDIGQYLATTYIPENAIFPNGALIGSRLSTQDSSFALRCFEPVSDYSQMVQRQIHDALFVYPRDCHWGENFITGDLDQNGAVDLVASAPNFLNGNTNGTGALYLYLNGDLNLVDTLIMDDQISYHFGSSPILLDYNGDSDLELVLAKSNTWYYFSSDTAEYSIEIYSFGSLTVPTQGINIVNPIEAQVIEVFPSPFNSSLTIRFSNPIINETILTIYSITGQVVFEEMIRPGELSTSWQGISNAGIEMPSGVYIVSLGMDREVVTTKTILIR